MFLKKQQQKKQQARAPALHPHSPKDSQTVGPLKGKLIHLET